VIWILMLAGFGLALFGASAAAAILLTSRSALAEAVSRRLRGGSESLAWLQEVDRDLAAASITTSLAFILLGVAVPALLAGASLLQLGLFLIFPVVPVILFSGFMLPRWLTQPRAEWVAALLGPVIRPWGRLLGVLLPSQERQRPADLRVLWHEGAQAGLAPDQELVMVGGVMAFAQKKVRDVMTPRTDLVAVPESATMAAIRGAFTASGYTRVPVYRGTLDEVVGMIHAFDLFRLREGDPLPVRPVAMAPEGRSCADLLVDMQRERRHLAVVMDEFGGTLGIVTLEDLLEAMVGEIFDEDEAEARGADAPELGLLETDGATPVADVEAHFGVTLPPGHAVSFAGRLVELAGRIPATGERFLMAGLEVDVLRASPLRVELLAVRRGSPAVTALGRAAP